MAVPVCECEQGKKRSTTCFLQCEKRKKGEEANPPRSHSKHSLFSSFASTKRPTRRFVASRSFCAEMPVLKPERRMNSFVEMVRGYTKNRLSRRQPDVPSASSAVLPAWPTCTYPSTYIRSGETTWMKDRNACMRQICFKSISSFHDGLRTGAGVHPIDF